MTTFGPGDIAANDWAVSGSNSFWTNLSTTVFSSGTMFRPIYLSVRWGVDSGTVTGRNDIWSSGGPRAAYTNNFNISTTGTGAYNVIGVASTWYLANDNYFGGFWRTASQNSHTPFVDGAGGNYGGLSADDSTIVGYTANWAGVASPGGLGWAVTYQQVLVYVRRAGSWTQITEDVKRLGSQGLVLVSVKRAGAWTPLNALEWLTKAEREIPTAGIPVTVDVGDGPEAGWLAEGGIGWFGSVDPDAIGNPGEGSHLVACPAPFTGRYSSLDSEERVHERLYARYRWERARRDGIDSETETWRRRMLPPQPNEHADPVLIAA